MLLTFNYAKCGVSNLCLSKVIEEKPLAPLLGTGRDKPHNSLMIMVCRLLKNLSGFFFKILQFFADNSNGPFTRARVGCEPGAVHSLR